MLAKYGAVLLASQVVKQHCVVYSMKQTLVKGYWVPLKQAGGLFHWCTEYATSSVITKKFINSCMGALAGLQPHT